ncbi:MAG: hypothetical protein R3266_15535 [Gemmatimonadota bacterium]|nr:hypothetical protein [Gemmatimonadota bacterium]
MASSEGRHGLRFEGVACDVCGEVFTREELDRHHWCEACRPAMLRRMRLWRHLVAVVVTLPIAVWVFTHPTFDRQPLALWALLVLAAYYLGYRLGREVVRIYLRVRGPRRLP